MNAMLLCALHRSGTPLTASDCHDQALGIAMDHFWPRTEYAKWSPKRAAAALRNMEAGGLVERHDTVRVEGNERDRWKPKGCLEAWSNRNFPVPDAPSRETDKHAIDAMSREQMLTLADVLGEMTAAGVRLRTFVATAVNNELLIFDEAKARARRQLLAIGISGTSHSDEDK